MKKLWGGICLVAAATLAVGAQGPVPTDQDKAAVKQAAYDYAEGFFEGAAERMERGVHPSIIKRGVMSAPGSGSVLMPMNAETLVELTRMGGAKKVPVDQRNLSFELLDIQGDVASARIFTSRFNDFLHLVKQGDRWRIAHVLWQPPSAGARANNDADKAAVAQAFKDFGEGLSAGDVARLERVVHPEAALRVFRPNRDTGRCFLQEGNRDAVLAQARAKQVPPMKDPAVTVLYVYDTIASAVMTTSTVMFYGHLVKQNDQWRLVNALMR